MAHRVVCTPQMEAAFRLLRKQGVSLVECAERLGVAYTTAIAWAQKLGINARRDSRRRDPGWSVMIPIYLPNFEGVVKTDEPRYVAGGSCHAEDCTNPTIYFDQDGYSYCKEHRSHDWEQWITGHNN